MARAKKKTATKIMSQEEQVYGGPAIIKPKKPKAEDILGSAVGFGVSPDVSTAQSKSRDINGTFVITDESGDLETNVVYLNGRPVASRVIDVDVFADEEGKQVTIQEKHIVGAHDIVNLDVSVASWSYAQQLDTSIAELYNKESELVIETTYEELKSKRDSAHLVPGAKYRITDYITTTTQIDTLSAMNQFDVIVTALDERHLSEDAEAAVHKISSGIVTKQYYKWTKKIDGISEQDYPYSGTYFMLTETLDFNPTYDDRYVPAGYMNQDGEEFYNGETKGYEFVEVVRDGNTLKAYKDQYACNQGADHNTLVDENEWYEITCDNDGNYPMMEVYEYYDVVPESNYIEIINDEVYYKWKRKGDISINTKQEDTKMFMLTKTLEIDCDETNLYEPEGYLTVDGSNYDNDRIYRSFWKFEKKGDVYRLYEFCEDGNYPDGKQTLEWYEIDTRYINLLPVSEGYFQNSNLSAWKLKYSLDNDTKKCSWADTENGKGVIYWMRDEWNNECPYDFKNIMFKRDISFNDVYPIVDNEEGEETWVYTFAAYDLDNGEWIDAVNAIGKANDSGGCCKCYGNEILPYSVIEDNQGNYDYPHYKLNDIVFLNAFSDSSVVNFNCYNNKFGNDCCNMSFSNEAIGNVFDNECYNNIFYAEVRDNTFGMYCRDNEFKNYVYDNIFGTGFVSNVFEANYIYRNKFGDDVYDNLFKSGVNNNTFGNNVNHNEFYYINYNTFGDDFYNNVIGILTNYSDRYNGQISNCYFGNNIHYIEVDGRVASPKPGARPGVLPLTNVVFQNNLCGTSEQLLTLTHAELNYKVNYTQCVGLKSNSEVKIWVPADTEASTWNILTD